MRLFGRFCFVFHAFTLALALPYPCHRSLRVQVKSAGANQKRFHQARCTLSLYVATQVTSVSNSELPRRLKASYIFSFRYSILRLAVFRKRRRHRVLLSCDKPTTIESIGVQKRTTCTDEIMLSFPCRLSRLVPEDIRDLRFVNRPIPTLYPISPRTYVLTFRLARRVLQ